MNPTPSLYQCLVLHEIADGRVWWSGKAWMMAGSHRDHRVTLQVEKLWAAGFINVFDVDGAKETFTIEITDRGVAAMERRPLSELLEELNSR